VIRRERLLSGATRFALADWPEGTDLKSEGPLTWTMLQTRTMFHSLLALRQLRPAYLGRHCRRLQSSAQERREVYPQKPIRSLFYVPGSSQKMIDKAWTLTPDNIVPLSINESDA